jgi:hypothetical protein
LIGATSGVSWSCHARCPSCATRTANVRSLKVHKVKLRKQIYIERLQL